MKCFVKFYTKIDEILRKKSVKFWESIGEILRKVGGNFGKKLAKFGTLCACVACRLSNSASPFLLFLRKVTPLSPFLPIPHSTVAFFLLNVCPCCNSCSSRQQGQHTTPSRDPRILLGSDFHNFTSRSKVTKTCPMLLYFQHF